MEKSYVYSEAARRKAQKQKSLREGEMEQSRGSTASATRTRKPATARASAGVVRTATSRAGSRAAGAPGRTLAAGGRPAPVSTPPTEDSVRIVNDARPDARGYPDLVRVVRVVPKSGNGGASRRAAANRGRSGAGARTAARTAAPGRGVPTPVRAETVSLLQENPLEVIPPRVPSVMEASGDSGQGAPPSAPVASPMTASLEGELDVLVRQLPPGWQGNPGHAPALGGEAPPSAHAAAPLAQPGSAPPLEGTQERLMLESAEMDLFGRGEPSKVHVCPDCHHELVRVVCLGTTVRGCVACKGVWFPLSVVHEFSRRDDWFKNLGPALHAAARPAVGSISDEPNA